jgi:hypothetical protein
LLICVIYNEGIFAAKLCCQQWHSSATEWCCLQRISFIVESCYLQRISIRCQNCVVYSEFVIRCWKCVFCSEFVIHNWNWIVCSELTFPAELCVLQRIWDSLLKLYGLKFAAKIELCAAN